MSNILTLFLQDKRSPLTRKEYCKDLRKFLDLNNVEAFLELPQPEAIEKVLNYKAELIERGLAPATINRRLNAIASLVKFAQELDLCDFTLGSFIKLQRVTPYKDTSGVSVEEFRQIVATVDCDTIMGIRDYAILRLLWENALRRGEVSSLTVGDFQPSKLYILGKGMGNQKTAIALSRKCQDSIHKWLEAYQPSDESDRLFVNVNRNRKYWNQLGGGGIYNMVRKYARKAGITKPFSPHRVRHSSITAALDYSNGDVRSAQKLSRHSNLNTLMTYDDNRQNVQLKVSKLLGDLVETSNNTL